MEKLGCLLPVGRNENSTAAVENNMMVSQKNYKLNYHVV